MRAFVLYHVMVIAVGNVFAVGMVFACSDHVQGVSGYIFMIFINNN
jgi:hypothetical protein